MDNHKYVGLDVHMATIVAAVHDSAGKCLMQSVIQTRADAIRAFINGLSGTIHVAFEEGTHAAWLYELINPLVADVVVCDPRRNKLLLEGNKGDMVDANKLAHLRRAGLLKAVYHGEHGTRALKELAHSYDSLVSDSIRVMNRLKAVYRGRAIECTGKGIYAKSRRQEWLNKLNEPGVKIRTELLYRELDSLKELRREARKGMIKESRQQKASKLLEGVPGLGEVRAALIIATVVTPFRFRTKRQLWAYIGLAVVTRDSAEYEFDGARLQKRRRKPAATRGLNRNFNRRLKKAFKSAALDAIKTEPLKSYYQGLIQRGLRPELARLNVARKLAAVVLSLWKKGEKFDQEKLTKYIAA